MSAGADHRHVDLLASGEEVPAREADALREGGDRSIRPVERTVYPPERREAASLAIGVGFRKRCTAVGLAEIVGEALLRIPDLAGAPATLATIAEKDRPPLHAAAALLGLPVVILPKAALLGTGDRITTESERVRACLGIPSVAEAAALAAAGPGSRLVVARIASADATCAIAIGPTP